MPQRIPNGAFSRSYAFLHLDRRDLQQIFDIMSTAGDVKIQSEGYEYASVTDLVEDFGRRRLKEVRFDTAHARVSIDRNSANVVVLSSGPTTGEAASVGFAVDELLNQRRRPLTWSSWLNVFGLCVGVCVLGLIGWVNGRGILFGAMFLASLGVFSWLQRYETQIVLHEEHEPFLRRHQEAIIASVVSVVLTLCGTALYDWVKSR